MTITETMRARMMTARKNKDKKNCDFYSYVVGELEAARKAKQTAANPNPVLTEQEEIGVITVLYNKSKKAISETKEKVEKTKMETTADLIAFYAEKEAEMTIYAEFMPKQMSEEEIKEAIQKAVNMIPDATNIKINKGMIMKNLMPMVKGKADGKLVAQLVDEFIKSLN